MKVWEKFCEKFDVVIVILVEIKSKFWVKFFCDIVFCVDLEREESFSYESDFDSEYEIVELYEYIVFIGGVVEDD